MTNEERRERIVELEIAIVESTDPSSFVLNKETLKFSKEISRLQSECPHEFDDTGICVYCFSLETQE